MELRLEERKLESWKLGSADNGLRGGSATLFAFHFFLLRFASFRFRRELKKWSRVIVGEV